MFCQEFTHLDFLQYMLLLTPHTVTKLRSSTGVIVMLAFQLLALIRSIKAAIIKTIQDGPTVCKNCKKLQYSKNLDTTLYVSDNCCF